MIRPRPWVPPTLHGGRPLVDIDFLHVHDPTGCSHNLYVPR